MRRSRPFEKIGQSGEIMAGEKGIEKEGGIKSLSLGEFGAMLAMRPQGKRVQESLDAQLRSLPPGGVLVLDFDNVEMMDYSFADEAIGTLYSRLSAKEYPDRYLVLLTDESEITSALLEN